MPDQTIPRDRIAFSAFAKDIVDALETACRTHMPGNTLMFFVCDRCAGLHIEVAEDVMSPGVTFPPNHFDLKH